MKRDLLIILLCLHPIYSFTQKVGQERIDSLLLELNTQMHDTTRIGLLIDICQSYWSVNPQEGIVYGKQAVDYADKSGIKKYQISAHGLLGNNYSLLSDFDNAQIELDKCLQISIEDNNHLGIARAAGTKGNMFYYLSRYPEAIESYLQSLKAAESLGDKMGAAACLNNIGSIYHEMDEHDKALEYFLKAVAINEEAGMKIYLVRNYQNIGLIYSNRGDFANAMNYTTKALLISREEHNEESIAQCFSSYAADYQKMKEYEKSLLYCDSAIQKFNDIGLNNQTGIPYTIRGDALFEIATENHETILQKFFGGTSLKCLQEANICADSAVKILMQAGAYDPLQTAFELQSRTRFELGDIAGALESFRLYHAYNDSVFNMEKDKKLTQTAMQYEFEKKEAATKAEQDKKDIRERNIRNSIAVGLAGALIFLVVVYIQRNKIAKEKKRSDELLLNILPEETAEELKATGTAKARNFDEVTVLFTDFKNFTLMSEQLSAQELVNEINYCYSAFDVIVSKYGIEKIKTIGDSYMCAGGLPVINKTNAIDTVKAAIEIRDFIAGEKSKRMSAGKPFFDIRIGCHTGPVVAGIVGIKKFAYDIWGDTVNLASRMESSGQPGKVNVSESTYALIRDQFQCEHRGKIEAKNKGMVDMYFIEPI